MRLLGLTEEQRLDFEQATGIKTEAAQIIIDQSVQQSQDLIDAALKEIQGVIGPHGSVSRLQAGGVNITRSGIGIYTDGVLKTTIDQQGNLLVGSDITSPSTTTLCAFVNDQIYNNESMGAGDLLIGDNTSTKANVKYDASAGKLEFRYGTTVNVYIDTDGTLKAGAGVVTLDADGITIQGGSGDANKIKWVVGSNADFSASFLGNYTGSDGVLSIDTSVGSGQHAMVLLVAEDDAKVTQINLEAGTTNLISINYQGQDVDTVIKGDTDASLFVADAGLDAIGIGGAAESGYKVKVTGKVNLATGNTYDINGSPHTHEVDQRADMFSDAEGDPAAIGTAADGTSTYAARRDHVHAITNGNAVLGSSYDITASAGTFADTGLSVTLPSAGTYEITANVRGAMVGNAGTSWWITAELYNSTDSAAVTDSERLVVLTGTTALHLQNTCVITKIVTVAASKTIKLYACRNGTASPTFTVSQISSDANGKTELIYKKIG